MRRVLITGIGLRTPLGHTASDVFDGILAGRTGVRVMPGWEAWDGLQTRVGASIPDFDGHEIPRKFRRTMGRVALLAASAAAAAAADAGIGPERLGDGRTAVVVGSTIGSSAAEEEFWRHLLTEQTTRGLRSTLFFKIMSHTCATNVALWLGVTGEVVATNAACASATQAIGMAADRIRSGRTDLALAGGAEELHPSAAITFDVVGGSSSSFNDDPECTPRPFDKGREGIVVGEGAGILVLESEASARARGAKVYGEVLGFGSNCDAMHMSSPSPGGMSACIRLGLQDAGLDVGDLDYVNAHATGTRIGDAAEAEALHGLVGDRIPVSSSKGHLGHLLGACGAVEAAICLEAMRRGVVPPTRNLTEPDVHPLDLPREPREATLRRVLSTNFAFGGINTCLVLGGNPWS